MKFNNAARLRAALVILTEFNKPFKDFLKDCLYDITVFLFSFLWDINRFL